MSDEGQIIAPGGWCAPYAPWMIEQNEQQQRLAQEVREFFDRELERTKPPRGGIRYPVRER